MCSKFSAQFLLYIRILLKWNTNKASKVRAKIVIDDLHKSGKGDGEVKRHDQPLVETQVKS